ncbi:MULTISPECIES: DegT/DnrJ/EryC1/StrS aminotransferase family protein [Sorangium]|uniref:Capsular polysaccharide biosynthesis protein n=1 Tax=Sorangium cellulosum TaxID=56 RepID=A0A4P2QUV2_SORCE|nr:MULTISPECIES: DegT/DnrJ/EryC1/StrS family aminotransferase [Sorangium]AUX34187.1 capsular polysaccharide biosynthesis protein [Sorangium cellulosum]WCQ93500.1 UDP-4-amino-4-deoxy-L-arabinose--oxoglutarate aminotransferase [Sorangium sp. Soce836]
MSEPRIIAFSPPDISQREIDAVVEVLRSGWLTTGPVTRAFEREIAAYCGAEAAVCLSSATAGLELVLRLLGVGPGDEVITTAYTFAATCNVIRHTGASPVFVDIKEGEFHLCPTQVERALTEKTKVVIPVDFAGWPCDYDELKDVLTSRASLYRPAPGTLQESFDRVVLLSDAAHSFGATYKGKKVGSLADFTVFSFHAVKNLTTAEGGAVVFSGAGELSCQRVRRELMLLAMHGQSKDAMEKFRMGGWFYTIEVPGYKYNMTDIAAALGRAQLARYDGELLPKRQAIFDAYSEALAHEARIELPPFTDRRKTGSCHLYPIRVRGRDEGTRNSIIQKMAELGISTNVHFIPVLSHPAYLDFAHLRASIPNTFRTYESEISMPIYPSLTAGDVEYICDRLRSVLESI